MKVYQSVLFESEVIPVSSYRCIDESELSIEEKIMLKEFQQIMLDMNLDSCYHLGNYAEERICLFKMDNLWEVYIAERGNSNNKVIYDNCFEACMEVIGQVVDTKEDCKKGKERLKRRIKKMENR